MASAAATSPRAGIVYPDSDGLPMAENTLQYRWIVTIVGGLEHLFADDPDVFVAGDLFWYPVEGHPEIVAAPDAMVAFGRPKGDRMSYMQWEEAGVPPQVVLEVLSPSNRRAARWSASSSSTAGTASRSTTPTTPTRSARAQRLPPPGRRPGRGPGDERPRQPQAGGALRDG